MRAHLTLEFLSVVVSIIVKVLMNVETDVDVSIAASAVASGVGLVGVLIRNHRDTSLASCVSIHAWSCSGVVHVFGVVRDAIFLVANCI